MQSRNVAARVGRWSAQHRKTAVLGWILFVVLATFLGGKVGTTELENSASGNGESKRGDMIVDAADFPEQSGGAGARAGQGLDESRPAPGHDEAAGRAQLAEFRNEPEVMPAPA